MILFQAATTQFCHAGNSRDLLLRHCSMARKIGRYKQRDFSQSWIISVSKCMSLLRKQSVLATLQLAALLSASAQAAAIDPALLAKAQAGDPVSEVLVGESYAEGKLVAKDLKTAAAWYRRAADQGSISAERHLAALYRDGGKGFPRDMAQAAIWYAKAAEQGDVTAQATLGLLYSIGQGLPQNNVEAYFWLDLAASVPGPSQQQYAANRQMIGSRLTTDELAEAGERVAQWLAAHPRSAISK